MATAAGQRSNSRIGLLLDAAAMHFASRGYRDTTIRDISHSIGMLPGSVYYHFPSKDRLLLAVYEAAVKRIDERVKGAVDPETSLWDQLEAMMVAHIESLHDQSDYARLIARIEPSHVPEVAPELTVLRNAYEEQFVGLIRKLPLAPKVDRRMLRLMIMGALNWSPVWYKPGQYTPQKIGKLFVEMLRRGTERKSTS